MRTPRNDTAFLPAPRAAVSLRLSLRPGLRGLCLLP